MEVIKLNDNMTTVEDLISIMNERNIPLNTPIMINGGELRYIYTDGHTIYLEETVLNDGII